MQLQSFIIDFYRKKEYYKYKSLLPKFLDIEEITHQIIYLILKNSYRFPNKNVFLSFFRKTLQNICKNEIHRCKIMYSLSNFEFVDDDDNRDGEEILHKKMLLTLQSYFLCNPPDVVYEKEQKEKKKKQIKKQIKDVVYSEKKLKEKYGLSDKDIEILHKIYEMKVKKNLPLRVISMHFPDVSEYKINHLYSILKKIIKNEVKAK